MKMMRVLSVLTFILVVFSYQALATPIFVGDPSGDPAMGFGEGLLPDMTNLDTGPGYYIWSNNDTRTSWSVRWTGADWADDFTVDEEGRQIANTSDTYSWAGTIIFSDPEGLDQPVAIAWEDGQVPQLVDGIGSDKINFGVATAGPHWDGFDFTLTGTTDPQDYLTFNLESTFFTLLNDGVYMGADLVSVLDFAKDGDTTFFRGGGEGMSRQFEAYAPVPEPGTILLLGSGLVGLVYWRRKKD